MTKMPGLYIITSKGGLLTQALLAEGAALRASWATDSTCHFTASTLFVSPITSSIEEIPHDHDARAAAYTIPIIPELLIPPPPEGGAYEPVKALLVP